MTVSIGVLGALVGSFLNVVIHRLPRRESLAFPPSHCTSCDTPIRRRDNIPLMSWLALRGRCRSCGIAISKRYPAVELLTALVFALVALVRGLDVDLLLALPFTAMLVAVAGIDLEHRIVPNRIVAPAAIYAIAITAATDLPALPAHLLAGAGAFAFFLAAAIAYPSGMGVGDVKLAGVMGLFLGVAVVPALFVAFVAGTVVGLVVLARAGGDRRARGVPFAPFLALGGIVGTVAGAELVELYARVFLA